MGVLDSISSQLVLKKLRDEVPVVYRAHDLPREGGMTRQQGSSCQHGGERKSLSDHARRPLGECKEVGDLRVPQSVRLRAVPVPTQLSTQN